MTSQTAKRPPEKQGLRIGNYRSRPGQEACFHIAVKRGIQSIFKAATGRVTEILPGSPSFRLTLRCAAQMLVVAPPAKSTAPPAAATAWTPAGRAREPRALRPGFADINPPVFQKLTVQAADGPLQILTLS